MEKIRLAFLGDIMPGGLLHYQSIDFINDDVLEYLEEFDLRIATLECAIGDDFEYYKNLLNEQQKNKNIVYALNEDINKLKKLKIDIVTIANNHISDLGEAGLLNTIDILNQNNIKFCGAGRNVDEASKPVVTECRGKTISFIGCSELLNGLSYANEKTPGINLLNIERLEVDIRKAKQKYDYVFVLPHWGIEHASKPSYYIKEFAYRMINAGADGVFGGHSHSVQPNINYKGKPVFFSMGNFLFPSRYQQPPCSAYYPEQKLVNIPLTKTAKCSSISIKFWRSTAMIGMIVNVEISKYIRANKKLTILEENKSEDPSTFHIVFCNDEAVNNRLKKLGLFVKYAPRILWSLRERYVNRKRK